MWKHRSKRYVITQRLCAVALFVAGCDGGGGPIDAGDAGDGGPVDGGPTCTEPLASSMLATFPDRALLVEDATTETGYRLRFDPDRYPALSAVLGGLLPTLTEDLSEVDGFGVNAEAYFRFGRDFDPAQLPAVDDTEAARAAGFVVLGPSPRAVPALLSTEDGTLFLSPLTPLPPRAEIVAYVTRALTAAAGGCLEPSEETAERLASPDAITQEAIDALVALSAITSPDELVAITVYPTQSIYEDGIAVAADVASRDFDFVEAPTCVDEAAFTRCVGAFVAGDYRDTEGSVLRRAAGAPATPVRTYTIPFTAWLPLVRSGAVPTLLFQHGLTSDREWGGSRLAEHYAPLGMAVVAIDAVEHGEHPTVPGPREAIDTMQAFFAISLEMRTTRAVRAAALRDNFAQSTFDRLQFVRLLVQHPDVDGVEGADLDLERLAMIGVSAGGIMVTEHVALDPQIGAAVLIVPGGRLATLMSDSVAFGPLVSLLRPTRASEGDVRRFFPIMQTIVERGDPASWAGALFRERVAEVPGRADVLVGVALGDGVMPNSGTYALGRALGLPMVEVVVEPQVGFPIVAGPISGNVTVDGAPHTAGFLQFDVVDVDGELVPVDHNNLTLSEVGDEAWTHFLTTHFEGAAEIRDPYAALGLAHP